MPIHLCEKDYDRCPALTPQQNKNLLAVVYAFEIFRPYLVLSEDRSKLMSSSVIKKVEQSIYAASNHLSRLENPHQSDSEKKEIIETFLLKTLGMVTFRGDYYTLWFSDIANYYAGNFIVYGRLAQQRRNSFRMLSIHLGAPTCLGFCADK
ncbi:hypothetical protein Tco_0756619 [Tanacetum coccineum]